MDDGFADLTCLALLVHVVARRVLEEDVDEVLFLLVLDDFSRAALWLQLDTVLQLCAGHGSPPGHVDKASHVPEGILGSCRIDVDGSCAAATDHRGEATRHTRDALTIWACALIWKRMEATSETLCNCLAMRQAARQITQLYDAALAETGLRVTQYSVLAVLGRRGPSSVQDLAAALVMDRSTLGHNLRPLERDGLVRLEVDEEDRRARRLALTPAGKDKLEEARPHWRRAQKQFESSYGVSEAKELRATMQRVVESTAT